MGIKTTAIAEVTVSIDLNSTWGADCKIEQVFKQATDHAIGIIRNIKFPVQRIHIVGKPKIRSVLVDEDYNPNKE